MNKKSQGALEFLTTYGWAFLVILLMIGAMMYFGILNPNKFLPERCTTSTGFQCLEHQLLLVTSGSPPSTVLNVSFQLKNVLSDPINISNCTVTSDILNSDVTLNKDTHGWKSVIIDSGDTSELTFKLDSSKFIGGLPKVGTKQKISMKITYTPYGKSFSQKMNVEIFGEVN